MAELIPERDFDEKMPRLVFLDQQNLGMIEENANRLPINNIEHSLVLSPSAIVNLAALLDQGVNANSAILCLAAVGLDLLLPNISVDLLADDEIEEIKE